MADIETLIRVLWYRDFPVPPGKFMSPANWTIHWGIVVRTTADLLGFITDFESGGRSDAILRTGDDKVVANLEWEWQTPKSLAVNEVKKLRASKLAPQFSVFISYAKVTELEEVLSSIVGQWAGAEWPLLLVIIEFEQTSGSRRDFVALRTCQVKPDGAVKALRVQPALPSKLPGTRWYQC